MTRSMQPAVRRITTDCDDVSRAACALANAVEESLFDAESRSEARAAAQRMQRAAELLIAMAGRITRSVVTAEGEAA